jgi:hypothetical protein
VAKTLALYLLRGESPSPLFSGYIWHGRRKLRSKKCPKPGYFWSRGGSFSHFALCISYRIYVLKHWPASLIETLLIITCYRKVRRNENR